MIKRTTYSVYWAERTSCPYVRCGGRAVTKDSVYDFTYGKVYDCNGRVMVNKQPPVVRFLTVMSPEYFLIIL